MQLPQGIRVKLRERIGNCFSNDDLKILCFDLGLNYDVLSGDNLDVKIINLIQACERNGRTNDLVIQCSALRPYIQWDDIYQNNQKPVSEQREEQAFLQRNGKSESETGDRNKPLKPFGEVACEDEIALLKGNYRSYYFSQTPFCKPALDPDVYLVIGRRGSGKTALSHYLSFQSEIQNAIYLSVDQRILQAVMRHAALETMTEPDEIALPRLARFWEVALWFGIFDQMRNLDERIRQLCEAHDMPKRLWRLMGSDENGILSELEKWSKSKALQNGKAILKEVATQRPLLVAFDTLENYSVHDEGTLRAIASLVQCATAFHKAYAFDRIYLKLFLMSEIFPYLRGTLLQNSLKFIHDEIYLHWRPKDLMRLISWRFNRYLEAQNKLPRNAPEINWEDHHDVLTKMWEPYFGDEIHNEFGIQETSFAYLLRHTQMRPRQLIVLCQSVAKEAWAKGTFPRFGPDHIVDGVATAEKNLAWEVFNSYAEVYPQVDRIVMGAMNGISMIFAGKELDKRAHQTSSLWTHTKYHPYLFRQLLAELGVIGRVRGNGPNNGHVEADFEYFMTDSLPVQSTNEEYVIHPMFFKKLNVDTSKKLRIYPFPDEQDYKNLGTAS